ncbi:hypothetical protein GmHk_20G057014 [Glycine max]|nr:hypothetical protein GmHk_20G057014 [Glycine max]KAH1189198.1 hypothetical protein GmHk_20G057014 [Glycine max]
MINISKLKFLISSILKENHYSLARLKKTNKINSFTLIKKRINEQSKINNEKLKNSENHHHPVPYAPLHNFHLRRITASTTITAADHRRYDNREGKTLGRLNH